MRDGTDSVRRWGVEYHVYGLGRHAGPVHPDRHHPAAHIRRDDDGHHPRRRGPPALVSRHERRSDRDRRRRPEPARPDPDAQRVRDGRHRASQPARGARGASAPEEPAVTPVRLAVAFAFALLALAGCGRSAPAPTAAPADVDVTALARAAFRRGDWTAAAPLLRQALGKEPASPGLHYYLAITDTYLHLSDAAEQEFKLVLANARAGSEEAETARRWLAPRGGGVRKARDAAAVDSSATGTSGLSGQVNWPDGPVQTARLQLLLQGIQGTPTAGNQYVRRADEQGRFEFSKIPPGSYKLTNRVAGRPIWRLRVQIPPDETLKLDLGPQNSLSARDDFPKDDT